MTGEHNAHASQTDNEKSQRHLSQEEIDIIKEQILASVYADIGRQLVKKFLWVVGATVLAFFAWLNGKGYWT